MVVNGKVVVVVLGQVVVVVGKVVVVEGQVVVQREVWVVKIWAGHGSGNGGGHGPFLTHNIEGFTHAYKS